MIFRRKASLPLAAALAIAFSAGCREDKSRAGEGGMPSVTTEGSAPATEDFPRPEVNAAELDLAPAEALEEVDSFYVRILAVPTKAEVRRKPDVAYNAARLLAGDGKAKAEAHKALVGLDIAAGCYLMAAAKAIAKERKLDSFSSEDAAMEVIYEIQDRYLRGQDMKALLRYFAAATGKNLLVERKILEIKRAFDVRNIYPLPALSRVADALELEDELWRGMDMNAETLELSTRMAYNLRLQNEEVSWLIEALGRVGNVQVHLEEGITASVTMRVRAETTEDAISQIAREAGLKVRSNGGAIWIGRN